ncbi:hypothetical protein [Fusobacterium polymorphum]|jgi:hypothetical protein|uniref:hypothetical protein n=1 Tax=Fusobacterium nucleatum subsp. polymorphum TaxID=76857 RepID=UPI0030080802
MIEDEIRAKKKRLKVVLRKEWELFNYYEKNVLYKSEVDRLVNFLVDLKEFNVIKEDKVENYKGSKLVLNKTNYRDYEYNANRNYIGDIFKESTEKDLGNFLIKILEKIGYKNIEFSNMGEIYFEENKKDIFLETLLNMYNMVYFFRIETTLLKAKNEDLNKEFYENSYNKLKLYISHLTLIDINDIEIDLSNELKKIKNNKYGKELLKLSIMLKKYKKYTFTLKKKIEKEGINSEIVFKNFIFFIMEIWFTSEFKFYINLINNININKKELDINILFRDKFLDKLKKIKKPYSLNLLMKIFREHLENKRDSEFKKRYKSLEYYIEYFFDTELPEILNVLANNCQKDKKELEKVAVKSFNEDERIYILYRYYIIFYIINPYLEVFGKKISYYLNIFCINYIFKKVLDFVNFSYTSLLDKIEDFKKLKEIYDEYCSIFVKKKIELIVKENIKLNNFMLLINNFSENRENKIRIFLEENYPELKDKKNEAIGKKQSSIYLELLFYAMYNYFNLEEEKYFILIKEIVDNFSKKYLYTRGDTIPYLLPPEIDKILSIYSIFLNKKEKAEEYLYYVKNIYNFLIFISDSSLYTLVYLRNKVN